MSGWSGGSGLFLLLCFLKWKRVQCGCLFLICLSLFVNCWSLEVTCSVILVSLGRLWTRLVPGGVQGADLVEIVRSSGALLAPFWSHFWSKTVMCLRCFFRCCFECVLWILSGFGSTVERLLDHFFVFF